jgi:hypothetical protein
MTAPRTRRLLIAASSLADAEVAVEMARPILEWAAASPGALFVETDFVRFATGSVHGIVTAGGDLRPLPSAELARRMARRDAREIERRLAALASGAGPAVACEMAVGDLVSMACAATLDEDILLLGRRPVARRGGDVFFLGGPGPADAPGRALAGLLARLFSARLIEGPLDVLRDEEGLSRLLTQGRASVIVVDAGVGSDIDAADLRRLFAVARSPVAVIGASRIGAAVSTAMEGEADGI